MGLSRKPSGHPSLLDIIQQKPLQVNHQYDAQSEKQKREAIQAPRFAFRCLFSEARFGPERIRNVKQPNARRNLPH